MKQMKKAAHHNVYTMVSHHQLSFAVVHVMPEIVTALMDISNAEQEAAFRLLIFVMVLLTALMRLMRFYVNSLHQFPEGHFNLK